MYLKPPVLKVSVISLFTTYLVDTQTETFFHLILPHYGTIGFLYLSTRAPVTWSSVISHTCTLCGPFSFFVCVCHPFQYRVLMTGCWKALCFLLGPRPRDGEGEARVHFFSRFRPYRCTNIDLSWENSMTQPLLADVPGTLIKTTRPIPLRNTSSLPL